MAADEGAVARQARRLADLLGDEYGAEVLRELQAMLWAAKPSSSSASEPEGLVGAWQLNPRGTRLVARPASGDRRAWADKDEIPLPDGKQRLVLLGESTARGFLLDPVVTPAGLLQELLDEMDGDRWQCIDLAQTSAVIADLERVTRQLDRLQPDVVVLFAGSNWAQPVLSIGERRLIGRALASGGRALAREVFLRSIVQQRASRYLDELQATVRRLGARLVVVVPEYNLQGWMPEPGLSLGDVPAGAMSRWLDERRAARDAYEREGWSCLREAADRMIDLDNGRSPLGNWYRGIAATELGSGRAERASLEAARDLPCGSLLNHTPRCPTDVQDLLAATARHREVDVVDARAVLEDPASGLPAPEHFLDYVHLTVGGLRRIVRRIGEAVLGCPVPESRAVVTDAAEREADALGHLLAVVHGAYNGQPGRLLDTHIALAWKEPDVAASVSAALIGYVDRGLPAWLDPGLARLGRSRQARRYMEAFRDNSADLTTFADMRSRLLTALDAGGGEARKRSFELLRRSRTIPSGADLIDDRLEDGCLLDGTGASMQAEALFARALDPEQAYCFVLDGTAPLRITVDARLESFADQPASGEVRLNEQLVGTVSLERSWTRTTIEVPKGGVDGLNRLAFRWPLPGAHVDLQAAARRFGAGDWAETTPSYADVAQLRVEMA